MKYCSILILIFITSISLTSTSCKTETKAKAFLLTDTLTITQPELILTKNGDTLSITDLLDNKHTSFFFLRHAEKEKNEDNPNLTVKGKKRAEKLKQIFKNVDFSAIYSTNFKRTLQTAAPTAIDQNLQVQFYNHKEPEKFLAQVSKDFKSKKILVVGHSNSTPNLINSLLGQNRFPHIDESEYDNLFLVTLSANGKAEVIHLTLSV